MPAGWAAPSHPAPEPMHPPHHASAGRSNLPIHSLTSARPDCGLREKPVTSTACEQIGGRRAKAQVGQRSRRCLNASLRFNAAGAITSNSSKGRFHPRQNSRFLPLRHCVAAGLAPSLWPRGRVHPGLSRQTHEFSRRDRSKRPGVLRRCNESRHSSAWGVTSRRSTKRRSPTTLAERSFFVRVCQRRADLRDERLDDGLGQ